MGHCLFFLNLFCSVLSKLLLFTSLLSIFSTLFWNHFLRVWTSASMILVLHLIYVFERFFRSICTSQNLASSLWHFCCPYRSGQVWTVIQFQPSSPLTEASDYSRCIKTRVSGHTWGSCPCWGAVRKAYIPGWWPSLLVSILWWRHRFPIFRFLTSLRSHHIWENASNCLDIASLCSLTHK